MRITTDQGRQFESKLFTRLREITGSERFRTTAYHPQANGLVERFHRQLKTAIKCHNTEDWATILPVVLLGIRTAWKQDISATAAEMVYGATIRIPGEFSTETPLPQTLEEEDYVTQLRRTIQALRPTAPNNHNATKSFVFQDLATATHVLIRDDRPRPPLRKPYQGPFRVISRKGRNYIIDRNGTPTTIAAERVKPAYVETTGQREPTLPTITKTRSGRITRQPVRFGDSITSKGGM